MRFSDEGTSFPFGVCRRMLMLRESPRTRLTRRMSRHWGRGRMATPLTSRRQWRKNRRRARSIQTVAKRKMICRRRMARKLTRARASLLTTPRPTRNSPRHRGPSPTMRKNPRRPRPRSQRLMWRPFQSCRRSYVGGSTTTSPPTIPWRLWRSSARRRGASMSIVASTFTGTLSHAVWPWRRSVSPSPMTSLASTLRSLSVVWWLQLRALSTWHLLCIHYISMHANISWIHGRIDRYQLLIVYGRCIVETYLCMVQLNMAHDNQMAVGCNPKSRTTVTPSIFSTLVIICYS